MSLLFYVDINKCCVLHKEVVKLCPSLSTLSESEILFIVLYMDYNSPYKQLPDHQRKRQAMSHAFDDNEDELIGSDRMKVAMSDYNSLQYNPKIEAARGFQQKIDSLLLTLQEDNSATNIKKIVDAI